MKFYGIIISANFVGGFITLLNVFWWLRNDEDSLLLYLPVGFFGMLFLIATVFKWAHVIESKFWLAALVMWASSIGITLGYLLIDALNTCC